MSHLPKVKLSQHTRVRTVLHTQEARLGCLVTDSPGWATEFFLIGLVQGDGFSQSP